LLVAMLAGCTTAPVQPNTQAPGIFDGEAALDFVKGFALKPDGSPRYRIPGTEGQREGAAYLWSQMAVPGWSRQWQNFTGADYLRLDRSTVEHYGPGSAYCSAEDSARLPGLPFHNLLAIRRGASSDRLFLLGTHWDSQSVSNYDPDPAKREEPYPGANDGASGAGVLLQLMRELRGVELPFDVGVLFIDGEDGFVDCHPLAGSLYFAQNPPVAVHRFLLLDMVGSPDARFLRESQSLQSDRALMDLLWEHGRALGGAVHFVDRVSSIVDDHVAFAQQGIPSVDLIDAARDGGPFPPEWHTTHDTVDKLSSQTMALVGSTILAVAKDPRFVEQWPANSG
jgi:hypothetical protein